MLSDLIFSSKEKMCFKVVVFVDIIIITAMICE